MSAVNRLRAVVSAVCLLVPLILSSPAAAVNEDVNKYWSIPPGIDPADTTDSTMCWAAAASNVLAYTGWGVDNASGGHAKEYDVYHEFLASYPNQGGTGTEAFRSYFQWHYGGAGALPLPPVIVQLYQTPANPVDFIDQARSLISQGYGLYLSLGIGHAVTLWDIVPSSRYGAWVVTITDSDDYWTGTKTFEIVQLTEGYTAGYWSLVGYSIGGRDYDTVLLRRIDALAPPGTTVGGEGLSPLPGAPGPITQLPITLPGIVQPAVVFRYAVPGGWTADEPDGPYAVPEPSAALLLVAGLAGLAAFARGRTGKRRT